MSASASELATLALLVLDGGHFLLGLCLFAQIELVRDVSFHNR
jgi:hypothetical protein